MKRINTLLPVKPGFDLNFNFNFKNFKIFAPLFALILCAALFVPSALAADINDPFMGFMETLAAPEENQNNTAALQTTTAGSGLSGTERELYDALSAPIRRIAYGKRESAVIEITDITEKNMETLMNAMSKVIDALLSDFPYELYWFDKTEGYKIQYETVFNQETNSLMVNITMSMTVAEAYRAGDKSDEYQYQFNTELAAAAQTAAANARSIVTANASKSDHEKIKAYKQEICALTDYNDEAVENINTPYGDPWQIIYVFDKDPETKVVCEGYAKAFQYLCDLTQFMGGTESRIVTGRYLSDIAGRTSGGDHMWNHVRLEGKWYLADITNCDGEDGASVTAVGYPDYLFLRGGAPAENANYAVSFEKFQQSVTVTYTIDTSEIAYSDREFLTLSTEDYEPDVMAERVLTAADFRVTDQQDPTLAPKLEVLHDGNAHGVNVSWVEDDMPERAGNVSAAYALYTEEDGVVSYGAITFVAPSEIGVYQIYANVSGNAANGYAQMYIPLAQRLSILSDRASTLNPDSTQTLTFGNSQSGSVSVVLRDMNDNPIADARITAALENESDSALITLGRFSFSTDENGSILIPFTTGDKEEGAVKIICEFDGDDDHDGSSCEIEIQIRAFAAISVEGTGEQASVTVTTAEQDLLRVPVFIAAYSSEGQLLQIAQNTIRNNSGVLSATVSMNLTGAARLRAFFVDSDGNRANIPWNMPIKLNLNGAA